MAIYSWARECHAGVAADACARARARGKATGRRREEPTGQREPTEHGEEEDGDEQSQMATVRPWSRGGERRCVSGRRGRGVQGVGDDEGYLLDTLMRAKLTRGGGTRARNHPARVHGMPEMWSPRALVHTMPQARPNDVWGLVLPA